MSTLVSSESKVLVSHEGKVLKIQSLPEWYNVLYFYSDNASNPMKNDSTNSYGTSQLKTLMDGWQDRNGKGIRMVQVDSDTFDPATGLDGIDLILTGSCNRVFNSTQRDAFISAVRNNGLWMLGYNDSSKAPNGAAGGYQNTIGQASLESMGFSDFGWYSLVDQSAGVELDTFATGAAFCEELTMKSEGTAPWYRDPTSSNHSAQGNPTIVKAHFEQDPTHKTGVPWSHAEGGYTSFGYSEVNNGGVVVMKDRQYIGNTGLPGADITQEDNTEGIRQIVLFALEATIRNA